MKNAFSILTLAAFSGTLLCGTGCKKSSSTYNATPASVSDVARNSYIVPGRTLLTLNEGYINTLSMNITSTEFPIYNITTEQRANLFVPLNAAGLPVPAPSHFTNLDLHMTTGTSTPGMPSMYLKGMVAMDNDFSVPVELIVTAPMTIDVHSPAQSIQPGTRLLDIMNIFPDRMGRSITKQMWEDARDPQSTIITISADKNPELYRILMADLGKMIQMSGATTANVNKNAVEM